MKRIYLFQLIALLCFAALSHAVGQPTASASGSSTPFVVNSSGDEGDMVIDGHCDVSTDSGLQCTLRAAIQEANDTVMPDTITFQIGTFVPTAATIMPADRLPAISRPLIIDARTQPQAIGIDGPILPCATNDEDAHNLLITLDGSAAGGTIGNLKNGLYFSEAAVGSAVYGMAIVNWSASGVETRADNFVMQCTHVGIATDGTTAAGNDRDGLRLSSAENSLIGGSAPSERNLFSGNTDYGLRITSGSHNSIVTGNYIGTDESGSSAVPNGDAGVLVNSSTNNEIGPNNLISGNGGHGVRLFDTNPANTVDNAIFSNLIGTNRTGTEAIPNVADGVNLQNVRDTEIGAFSIRTFSNLIAGNGRYGIFIFSGTSGTTIDSNQLGTTLTGGTPLPNGSDGIRIWRAGSDNTIERNRIAHNLGNGVYIYDGSDENTLQSNLIRNNMSNGVLVEDSAETLIGGFNAGNSIVSNGANGIHLAGPTSDGTVIQGNEIGISTQLVSTAPNAENGIAIFNAPNTVIGSGAVIPRGRGDDGLGLSNVVSGNSDAGILLSGADTTGTSIDANVIGSLPDEPSGFGNGTHGVLIEDGANGNAIGANALNAIRSNGAAGIAVVGAASEGNSVRINRISGNGGLGVDLLANGVTANDVWDVDSGPNTLINAPELTNRLVLTDSTTITGTLALAGATTATIDFYASTACDGSGYGEGQLAIGTLAGIVVPASGDVAFVATLGESVAEGAALTAIVTDADGNSSEFSRCLVAGSLPLAVTAVRTGVSADIAAMPIILMLTTLLLLTGSACHRNRAR